MIDLIVPIYNQDERKIKFLLDTIQMQKDVKMDCINVFIIDDGSEIAFNHDLIKGYDFNISYFNNQHKGISATRNFGMDKSHSDYLMFCDSDDGFCDCNAMSIIFDSIKEQPDIIWSTFLDEISELNFQISELEDNYFIHGKVYKRAFLKEHQIRFDEFLNMNEDIVFNKLCKVFAKNIKYIEQPFYMWKYNYDSITHHGYYTENRDEYSFMSYASVIDELIKAGLIEEAKKNFREGTENLHDEQLKKRLYSKYFWVFDFKDD